MPFKEEKMFNLSGMLLLSVIALTASAGAQRPNRNLGSDCSEFVKSLDQPMKASVKQISGEELGGVLDGTNLEGRPAYRVGIFRYFGAGLEVNTSDPRFQHVRIYADRGAMHECGYRIEVWPGPWNVLLGDTGSTSIRFDQHRAENHIAPGGVKATNAHAAPAVAGYFPGASWPIHAPGVTDAYIGLMHPKNKRPETLIVTFEKSASPVPTRILARLPMRFQSISTLPNLHKAGSQATLVGKDPNGPYRSVVLEMPDRP